MKYLLLGVLLLAVVAACLVKLHWSYGDTQILLVPLALVLGVLTAELDSRSK